MKLILFFLLVSSNFLLVFNYMYFNFDFRTAFINALSDNTYYVDNVRSSVFKFLNVNSDHVDREAEISCNIDNFQENTKIDKQFLYDLNLEYSDFRELDRGLPFKSGASIYSTRKKVDIKCENLKLEGGFSAAVPYLIRQKSERPGVPRFSFRSDKLLFLQKHSFEYDWNGVILRFANVGSDVAQIQFKYKANEDQVEIVLLSGNIDLYVWRKIRENSLYARKVGSLKVKEAKLIASSFASSDTFLLNKGGLSILSNGRFLNDLSN